MPSIELVFFESKGESAFWFGSPSVLSNSEFVSVSLWSETSKSSRIGSSSVSSSISSISSSSSSMISSGGCSTLASMICSGALSKALHGMAATIRPITKWRAAEMSSQGALDIQS